MASSVRRGPGAEPPLDSESGRGGGLRRADLGAGTEPGLETGRASVGRGCGRGPD